MKYNGPSKLAMSRRTVLKSAAVGSTGLAALRSVPKPTRAASSCPTADVNNNWTDDDYLENASGQNEGIYLSVDVGCIGVEWDSDYNVWRYKFKQQSASRSQEYPSGDTLSALARQEIKINEGTAENVLSYEGDCFIGARPERPSSNATHYDYYDVAYTVAKQAVKRMNSIAYYSLTAAELVSNYMKDDGGADGSDWNVHKVWDYYADNYSVYEELSNYNFWEHWVNDGETDYFDFKTITTSYWDNSPSVTMTFEMIAGYSPTRYDVSTKTIGGVERQMVNYSSESIPGHDWMIERIPPEKISERVQAGDIHVSPDHFDRLMESGRPLYYAYNPPVKLVEVKKTYT